MACTRPPSAPRSATSNVNKTSVFLEWIPPADTGGRKDVSYYIACKKCNWHSGLCEACGNHVRRRSLSSSGDTPEAVPLLTGEVKKTPAGVTPEANTHRTGNKNPLPGSCNRVTSIRLL
ncbi:ephrin type-A receptor 5-like [Crotalus adamanteus]|uniref:Ephrin type-A receptor 5-like n=1 Tax=Crotalus adamanteus TaxID=8729 RepID=A0AAW1B3R2_CROAD